MAFSQYTGEFRTGVMGRASVRGCAVVWSEALHYFVADENGDIKHLSFALDESVLAEQGVDALKDAKPWTRTLLKDLIKDHPGVELKTHHGMAAVALGRRLFLFWNDTATKYRPTYMAYREMGKTAWSSPIAVQSGSSGFGGITDLAAYVAPSGNGIALNALDTTYSKLRTLALDPLQIDLAARTWQGTEHRDRAPQLPNTAMHQDKSGAPIADGTFNDLSTVTWKHLSAGQVAMTSFHSPERGYVFNLLYPVDDAGIPEPQRAPGVRRVDDLSKIKGGFTLVRNPRGNLSAFYCNESRELRHRTFVPPDDLTQPLAFGIEQKLNGANHRSEKGPAAVFIDVPGHHSRSEPGDGGSGVRLSHADVVFYAEGAKNNDAFDVQVQSAVFRRELALEHKGFHLSDWMHYLPDDRSLAALTIPGTHDTCARYGGDMFQTQNLRLLEQLEAGVRFIDIRCRHIDDVFTIHHTLVYEHLNFGNGVLRVCLDYLKAHPRECIVMSVKEEFTESGNTRSFEETFDWYVDKYRAHDKFYFGDTIPKLAEVRGRVVLLRRFDVKGSRRLGLDVHPDLWPGNVTFELTSPPIKVQDQWKVHTLFDRDTKWKNVKGLLDEAATTKDERLYLDFGSGNSPEGMCYPYSVAHTVNGGLKDYFAPDASGRARTGRFGVVIVDFAKDELTGPIAHANLTI